MSAGHFRVLGIDPGSLTTGFGCVEIHGNRLTSVGHGTIKAGKSGDPVDHRLHRIHSRLRELLDQFTPHAVSLEEAFFGKNVRSALRIGEVRGVALLASAEAGLEVFQHTPAVIKKSVVGRGNADKSQVASMVKMILGLRDEKIALDASDALAIAICQCHRQGMARLLG